MLSERDIDYLKDIQKQIELAEKFLGGVTFEEFEADELRLYAVIRCLEIISEASRRLSHDLKTRHPHIQWRAMAGAGNVYRHGYEAIPTTDIWDTVKLALPQLRQLIDKEFSAS